MVWGTFCLRIVKDGRKKLEYLDGFFLKIKVSHKYFLPSWQVWLRSTSSFFSTYIIDFDFDFDAFCILDCLKMKVCSTIMITEQRFQATKNPNFVYAIMQATHAPIKTLREKVIKKIKAMFYHGEMVSCCYLGHSFIKLNCWILCFGTSYNNIST